MNTRHRRPATSPPSEPPEHLSCYLDDGGQPTEERMIDGMAADSFPASDPPAMPGLRLGRPDRGAARPAAEANARALRRRR
jgi:hypothetical protein